MARLSKYQKWKLRKEIRGECNRRLRFRSQLMWLELQESQRQVKHERLIVNVADHIAQENHIVDAADQIVQEDQIVDAADQLYDGIQFFDAADQSNSGVVEFAAFCEKNNLPATERKKLYLLLERFKNSQFLFSYKDYLNFLQEINFKNKLKIKLYCNECFSPLLKYTSMCKNAKCKLFNVAGPGCTLICRKHSYFVDLAKKYYDE